MKMKPCKFCGQLPNFMDDDFCYPLNRERTQFRAGCIESAGGCGSEAIAETAVDAVIKWVNGEYEHGNTELESNTKD